MQTMSCKCGTNLYLTKDVYKIKKNDKEYSFFNCSVLKCPDCESIYLPYFAKLACDQVLKSIEEEEINITDFDFEKIKMHYFDDEFINTDVKFIYDRDDYYFLPGLWREWNAGFLTPVFFNIEVLLKYSHHPDYSFELGADTYGNIYKGSEHLTSFGINRNGKVIMWLGDIAKLNVEEQHYLRSENINSDHDISSEFYDGQIDVIWAEPSQVNRLLKKRLEVHEKIINSYSFSLTQLEPETVKAAKNVTKLLVNTEHAFSNVIIPSNMIFVESINSKKIKRDLLKDLPDLKVEGLGGLKLFQMWLEKRLNINNAHELVSPLFILYDFRIAMAHLQSEKTKDKLLSSACERLGLEQRNRDYIKITELIFEKLENMYDEILSKLVT